MKLLLFLLIVTVCGSLSKRPIVPCSKKVETKYYMNGKFVGKNYTDEYTTLKLRDAIEWRLRWNMKKPFMADSLVISLAPQ